MAGRRDVYGGVVDQKGKRMRIKSPRRFISVLSFQRHLLFMGTDNTLQDCEGIEQGSVNDSDVIQDYKKGNQHLVQKSTKRVRAFCALQKEVNIAFFRFSAVNLLLR